MDNKFIIYSEDKILLKLLQQRKQLKLYDLHSEYLLSFGQIARSVNKFTGLGVLILDSGIVTLTEKGSDWIFQNRNRLFLSDSNTHWKKIPDNMWGTQIVNNKLFLHTILELIKFEDKER